MTTPAISPKLSLNFLSGSLDPRITFTRSTTATFTGSDGLIQSAAINAPRFDYDPVTLAAKGLLIEEQRTNLLTRSEEFNDAAWTKARVSVTDNAIVAPDGTLTGDKLVEDLTNDTHLVLRNVTTVVGALYTLSVYAKAAERTQASLQLVGSATFPRVWFDLTTATIITTSAATGTITSVGDDWYRLTLTATIDTTTSSARIYLQIPGELQGYQGNGTSGLYIWGSQLEAGAFATSYIPTTTTALTRNADDAVITGTNFSDFWQASKGGVLVQAIPSTVSGTRPLVQFDDGTADNIIALRGNTTNPELQIVDGGTPQATIDAGTIAANTPYSLTGWWQTNDCKARQNSGATVSDYTATIPTVTQMRIGSDGTNYLNGTIATIGYYNSFFGRPIYTRRKNKVFPSLL
jgi:hypothetical protein